MEPASLFSGCEHNLYISRRLHDAVTKRQRKLVKLLVEGGMDVNCRDEMNQTPLITACARNTCFLKDDQLRIIQYLLEQGANPGLKDALGKQCFDYVKDDTSVINCILKFSKYLIKDKEKILESKTENTCVLSRSSRAPSQCTTMDLRPARSVRQITPSLIESDSQIICNDTVYSYNMTKNPFLHRRSFSDKTFQGITKDAIMKDIQQSANTFTESVDISNNPGLLQSKAFDMNTTGTKRPGKHFGSKENVMLSGKNRSKSYITNGIEVSIPTPNFSQKEDKLVIKKHNSDSASSKKMSLPCLHQNQNLLASRRRIKSDTENYIQSAKQTNKHTRCEEKYTLPPLKHEIRF